MANFSPSLQIPLMSENQAAKEATFNTAIDRFEGATQRKLTKAAVANAATLTVTEFTSSFLFEITGLTANGTLTIPQDYADGAPGERHFLVRNPSNYTLQVVGDVAGSVNVNPLKTVYLYSDGATVGNVLIDDSAGINFNDLIDVDLVTNPPVDGDVLAYDDAADKWVPATPVSGGPDVESIDDLTDVDTTTVPPTDGQFLKWVAADSKWVPATIPSGGTSLPDFTGNAGKFLRTNATADGAEWVFTPMDIAIFAEGALEADERLARVVLARAWNMTNVYINAATAPSANNTFTIKKNGSSVGTVTLNSGETAVNAALAVSFAAGDTVSVSNGTNTTIADVAVTLRGTRNA